MVAEISVKVLESRQDGPDRIIVTIETNSLPALGGMRAERMAIEHVRRTFGMYNPAIEPQFVDNLQEPEVGPDGNMLYRRDVVVVGGR